MVEALELRLEAPIMSFGGPRVDARGPTSAMPQASMICGLVANALGWRHGDFDRLQALQERVLIAAREDRRGEPLVDYQTVDLGQSFMRDTGWTTWGSREDRRGGSASTGTHIRHRHYWADAAYLVLLVLREGSGPSLDEVGSALSRPARPLFIGRKACLPSRRIVESFWRGGSLAEGVRSVPRCRRADPGPLRAWWPDDGGGARGRRRVAVNDHRDWTLGFHTGERLVWEDVVDPPGWGTTSADEVSA